MPSKLDGAEPEPAKLTSPNRFIQSQAHAIDYQRRVFLLQRWTTNSDCRRKCCAQMPCYSAPLSEWSPRLSWGLGRTPRCCPILLQHSLCFSFSLSLSLSLLLSLSHSLFCSLARSRARSAATEPALCVLRCSTACEYAIYNTYVYTCFL